MSARLELVDIREDDARMTGLGAVFQTDTATYADFEARRLLAVPVERADFLLDLYDAHGDLVDTLALSSAGFEVVIGEPPQPHSYYVALEESYYANLKALDPVEALRQARIEALRQVTT